MYYERQPLSVVANIQTLCDGTADCTRKQVEVIIIEIVLQGEDGGRRPQRLAMLVKRPKVAIEVLV